MNLEEQPKCELCGHPMPEGEEMFNFHGYSGPCPGPPIAQPKMRDKDEIIMEMEQRLAAAEPALREIADFDEVEDTGGDLEDVAIQCIAIAKIALCGKSGGRK